MQRHQRSEARTDSDLEAEDALSTFHFISYTCDWREAICSAEQA